jgi:hypothetical protein
MHPAEEGDPSIADTIVASWDQLLAQAHAVYVGRWKVESDRSGVNSFCVTSPVRRVHGPEGGLPERICTSVADVVGYPTAGYAFPAPDDMAWVVTAMRDDREVILTATPDPWCEDECVGAEPHDSLVQNYRCGQLERLWSTLPEEHLRCASNDDCVALTAMCFETAVNASAAPAYREVLERFGGICLSPLAGACPTFPVRAECRNEHCAALR